MNTSIRDIQNVPFAIDTTVTMCGKMKYEEEMRTLAARLELDKLWNMLLPISVKRALGEERKIFTPDIYNLRRIHYSKIWISDAILVYADSNGEFLDSDNVMGEILAAVRYCKDIYFSRLLSEEEQNRVTEYVSKNITSLKVVFKFVKYYSVNIDDDLDFHVYDYTLWQ